LTYTEVWLDVTIRVGYNDGKGVEVLVLCDGQKMRRYTTRL